MINPQKVDTGLPLESSVYSYWTSLGCECGGGSWTIVAATQVVVVTFCVRVVLGWAGGF